MSTPNTTPYNVVLHTEATVNGKAITVQEAIPAHLWDAYTPDFQDAFKNTVRRQLGVAIGTELDFPVTVTRGEPQVMTTSGAAPGHGGSTCVTSRTLERATADVPVEYRGRLIIVWPAPGLQVGERVVLVDADTGERITSAVEIKLTASPRKLVVAELLMLVDEQGVPLAADASPVLTEDGEGARTAVFHWLVTGLQAAADDAVAAEAGGPDPARDAALNDGAAAVFGLDFDLKRDGYEFDSHRQAWELGTIDAAKHLRSMTARPVDQEASVARLERGREQLVEAMSLVSKKRYWAEWERNLDRSLHSEGGMWEILGRTVGWPVGEWKPLTWMSWDDAGALYASRPAPGE